MYNIEIKNMLENIPDINLFSFNLEKQNKFFVFFFLSIFFFYTLKIVLRQCQLFYEIIRKLIIPVDNLTY